MIYVNCTPHNISYSFGEDMVTIETSGHVARVSASYKNVTPCYCPLGEVSSIECSEAQTLHYCNQECRYQPNIYNQNYGEIVDLPEPVTGTTYIVSVIVLQAAKAAGRTDCVAPATGHPATIRNNAGNIVSVPGFIN